VVEGRDVVHPLRGGEGLTMNRTGITRGLVATGVAVTMLTGLGLALDGAVTSGHVRATASHATAASHTSLADLEMQMGVDKMWAAGYTGNGVDVALIDTGVAPVKNLSTTSVFVGPDLSLEGGAAAVAGLDTYGHGTHMAGIIAGRTPGADPAKPRPGDFIGVAPDARLVSVKVGDHTGAVDVSQVIAAIDWVVQNQHRGGLNIRVINLSYDTLSQQSELVDPLSKAVENAWKHGIVVVVSAGNAGRTTTGLGNPATNPYVIAVSAAHRNPSGAWEVPTWASSGDSTRNPDVVAPGASIMSLRNPGSTIDIQHPEARLTGQDQLFLGTGTSQAAAAVSGAVALVLQQRPDLTPDQVKSVLLTSAADIGAPATSAGRGLVDLGKALTTPAATQPQTWPVASGLGSLEGSRGADHVTIGGQVLVGENTVTGEPWNPTAWVAASEAAHAWSGSSWSGSSWSGSSWSGSSWSGSSWSGSSWSGSSWSGSSWSGSSWSGSSWSGSSWSGSSWSGSSWSGSSWS
jgi:serine protease AprX